MSGRKIRLCPTKATSQPTQLSGVKLKKSFISYRRLKTQRHSVNIGFPCPGFPFCEHFNRQFTYAVFDIQNRKTCFNKHILYQYFIFLLGAGAPLKKIHIHFFSAVNTQH